METHLPNNKLKLNNYCKTDHSFVSYCILCLVDILLLYVTLYFAASRQLFFNIHVSLIKELHLTRTSPKETAPLL